MFTGVFIPIDTDQPSSWAKALPAAVAMARAHDVPLTLGSVISDWDAAREAPWSPAGYRKLQDEARHRLGHIADQCGYERHSVLIGGGSVGGGILDLAKQAGADLIVLASHHPGARDYLIGAHALHVVRHARCSVFVVRE